MKQALCIIGLIFVCCALSFARNMNQTACQNIKIKAPQTIRHDESVKVFASFENAPQNSSSKFNWTILAGGKATKIFESEAIEISGAKFDDEIEVVLLVESSTEKNCSNISTATIYVVRPIGSPLILDEYTEMIWKNETPRLSAVASAMQNLKDEELLIFVSFGPKTSQTQNKNYLRKILNYLSTKGLGKESLIFLISKAENKSVKFQPVPKQISQTYAFCEKCLIIKGNDFEILSKLF